MLYVTVTKKLPATLLVALLTAFISACKEDRQPEQNQAILVGDDLGRIVRLTKPAQRIVALSPHIVENLFSAGLGDRIVATVDYADYPAAASNIARVGGYANFSLESIIAFKPDLIVGWGSGYAGFEQLVKRIEKLGIAIYVDEPKSLSDIARSVENLATLGATSSFAQMNLRSYQERLNLLRLRYANKRRIRVFYPIWPQPLQTLNSDHIVNDVIELCGGSNLFADAAVLAPIVNIETVLARNPDVIIASASHNERPNWLDDWKRWPSLNAVKNDHLYFVPGDLLSRHTLRMLEGAEIMCNAIEKARQPSTKDILSYAK